MRHFIIASLFVLLNISAFSQPIVGYGHGHIRKNNEQIDTSSVQIRLLKAKTFVSDNKLTSVELINICKKFEGESFRFEIAKMAFNNVTDKQNFFEVYDLFTQMSLAVKLYHNTQANYKEQVKEEPVADKIIVSDADLKPQSDESALDSGDNKQVSDKKFMYHSRLVSERPNDNEKAIACKKLMEHNRYSTDQVRILVANISEDSERLEVVKFASKYYNNHRDKLALKDVLIYRQTIKKYMDYIK